MFDVNQARKRVLTCIEDAGLFREHTLYILFSMSLKLFIKRVYLLYNKNTSIINLLEAEFQRLSALVLLKLAQIIGLLDTHTHTHTHTHIQQHIYFHFSTEIYFKNKDSYVSHCYEIYKIVNKWQNKTKSIYFVGILFKNKGLVF